jgi:hypothetical protein
MFLTAMSLLRRAKARISGWRARVRHNNVSSAALRHYLGSRRVTERLGASRGSAPAATVRTSILRGKSSRFLNRVDLGDTTGQAAKLVEKGLPNDAGELSFWRGKTWPDPILNAERYNAVRPLHVYVGDPVSVLYFPYVPGLDRDTTDLRRAFRASMKQIAAALADFNGLNMMRSGSTIGRTLRFNAVRPTPSDLQRRLGMGTDDAHELVREWDRAHAAWQATQDTLAELPWCLCHNDVSPGNSLHVNGVTTFADFGLACSGPVGSDLHTLLRWSGKAIDKPAHVDGLLRTYVDRIQAYNESITIEDVRTAAWATFFLRYTNLKFASARYPNIFNLAIRQMLDVSRSEPTA